MTDGTMTTWGRIAVAVLLGAVTLMLVGFLLYGVVFASLFREGALMTPGVMKQQPDVLWIVAGQLGFSVLVTLVVLWRGSPSLARGASTGALLGFLMAIGYDFAQFGTSNLWTLQATLVDPFISALLVASTGGVIGLVLRRGQTNEAEGDRKRPDLK